MLTYSLVRHLFSYKEGFLYWKVKAHKRVKVGEKAGYLHVDEIESRHRIYFDGKKYLTSRLIFLFHKGYLPERIDHENRNTLDDRIENLREATCSENCKNKSSRKNSSSKYLGVSEKGSGFWVAQISTNGKNIYLGRFKNENYAALIYNRAAVMYHKEFANLNIIKPEIKKKTMIKIKIEAENAVDARQQMLELLGVIPSEAKAIRNEKIAENFEASKMEVLKDEIPEQEILITKKRRTKAELALENAAPAIEKELTPEGGDIQSDNVETETKEASKAITADMLKEKAVELIRNNKKPEVTALVKSFGADSVATADKNPIKPEDYVRFMDEMNKL